MAARGSSKSPVLKVEKRSPVGELAKHGAIVPERFVFADNRNNPDGKLYAMIRVIDEIKEPVTSETRVHSVDSVMMFFGNNPDLSGLEIEVSVDVQRYRLKSPASVYVKANQSQSYTLLKGSGFYEKLVLAEGGDYNKVTS